MSLCHVQLHKGMKYHYCRVNISLFFCQRWAGQRKS